jgi:hypothetical protein
VPLWASRCERLPFLPPERGSHLPSLGNPRSISSHCPRRLHLLSSNRHAKPGPSTWHLHRLGQSVTGPGGSVTREESLSLRNRLWNRCQKWIRLDENPTSSLAVSRIVGAVGPLSWLGRVPHGEGKRTGDERNQQIFLATETLFHEENMGLQAAHRRRDHPSNPAAARIRIV